MWPWFISIVALLLIAAGAALLVRSHRRQAATPPSSKDATMQRARAAMTGLDRQQRRATKGSIRRGGSGNAGVDGTSVGGSSGSDGGL
ncbi:hypothetical protein [Actinoplanes solisilvae]|uniref:hypothetical protein n=1 Tax=Actinoplanes solisilvae TaxID=2486853 RepID=UPI000FD76A70|nr:hypothetical protein [Actinoplanes solisilvae]